MFTSNYFEQNYEMKNNSYKQSKSGNKSFTYSMSTELGYEKSNDNSEKNLHGKHRNTSYFSNGFSENSQTFGTNRYKKNNRKRRRKSYTFGDSVSNNSLTDHYEKQNNNSFTKKFSYNKHRNTSYMSNGFAGNSQTYGINSSKKNNRKKRRKSCTYGDSVNSNSFTDHYEKSNDNFSIKDLSHNEHRNTSYISNSFSENSQTFGTNNFKKNSKNRRKSYTFGDSVSGNNFMSHEHSLPKRKKKYPDQGNVHVNKKPKYDDSTKSLQNSNASKSNSEGDQLNISDDKPDSEIFFFDISGNRYNSYESAFSASVNECRNANKKNISIQFNESIESLKKLRNSENVNVTDMMSNKIAIVSDITLQPKQKTKVPMENQLKNNNISELDKLFDENKKNRNSFINAHEPEKETSYSTSDSFEIPEKLKREKIESTENHIKNKTVKIESYIDEKIMKLLTKGTTASEMKSRKISNSNAGCDIIDENISKNYTINVERINPEDEDIAGSSKKPNISENKDLETVVNIGDIDCKTTVNDILFHKKKKKKKYIHELLGDALNQDENTTNRKNSTIYNNSFEKSKKTHRETLVDIRDSDCEMSVSDVSNRKKKKKKIVGDEVPEIKGSTAQEENIDNNNGIDDVGEISEQTTCIKSSKKSKKKNNTSVDLQDSDFEMSLCDVSWHQEKKKKKHRQNIDNSLEYDSNKTTENNDMTLVSPKILKEHKSIESLIEIMNSDHDTSPNTSNSKKNKKIKKSIDTEVPKIEGKNKDNFNDIKHNNAEETNEDSSILKSSKKSKKKNNTSVDVRDSDCEISFSNSSGKKKKKQKHEIELDNNEETAGSLESPKKFKKHRDIETLVDIRDSDCEMTVNDATNRKKKKKKRKLIGDEEAELEGRTSQNNNEYNFNNVGETILSSTSPKKSKEKNHTLIDHDCDTNFIDVSSRKKKKHREYSNYNVEYDGDGKSNKELNNGLACSKKSKSQKHIETSVDIRDSDCEMSVDEVPRRKKKKISIGTEESTLQETNIDNFNKKDGVGETYEGANISKKNDSLVDIRDSECEMSVTDISYHKKKEKKKKRKDGENSNDDSAHYGDENTIKDQDNMASSLMSPKKLKNRKPIDTLLGVRDSDFEMNVTEISRHKKKKNKKLSIEAEVSEIEEKTLHRESIVNSNNTGDMGEINMDTSSLLSPKTERNNTLVDIRDSECEMTISDVSYHRNKKKKKKNEHRENTNNDIEHYGDEKITNEQDNDITSNLVPPKRLKKHKGSEPLIDITDGNCEMSVKQKKNKKKKISMEAEIPETKKSTLQKKNIDNFNTNNDSEYLIDDISTVVKIEVTPDFPNNLPQISKIDTSPQSRFPENFVENLDSCKQGINVSMKNNNTKNNGKEYISSSEGYQSDSSEIISPIKHKRFSKGDKDETDFTSEDKKSLNLNSVNCTSQKGNGIDEDEFDVSQEMNNSSDVESVEEHSQEQDPLEISSMKKEEMLEDDIETVIGLNIVCSFSLCKLHSILVRPSRATKEELQEIKNLKLEVKTGAFNKEEDRTILNNWRTFCEEYNLTVNPWLFVSFPRKMKIENKTNFLRYLARGLDNRLLHRVHARFKNLLERPRRKIGRFSEEEDKVILDYLSHSSSKTPLLDLAEILNRTRESVFRRYELLNGNKNQTKVRWTPEVVDIFLCHMKKVTKCDVAELKDRKLTEKEWKKLSKKMDNIPVPKLKRGWRVTIYPRLFGKDLNSKVLKTIKEEVIHDLYERGETDWKAVNWKEIAEEYDGLTPEKIYTMFKHTVSYYVPKASHENLKECLEFLENKVLKYGQLADTHKFQKFVYEEGHIVGKYD